MSIKDIIVTVREAFIVLIFILLLATPEWINNRLEAAGFRKIDFFGLAEWEDQVEESKKEVEEVKKTTEEAQKELTQISTKLENLTSNPTFSNPTFFKREVNKLRAEVDASAYKLDRSKLELQKSLENHNILLHEIQQKKQ